MIRNPIDAAVYVSPQLSSFLELRVADPDVEQPVSLGQVRSYLSDLLSDSFREAEHMHRFDVSDSILDELEVLIAEYGESAPAIEFCQTAASEALSRVIEAVLDDESHENPPTLDAVRAAMAAGLVTRLIGEGVLEEDEDDALWGEIEALVERYGGDTLAENLLRYE